MASEAKDFSLLQSMHNDVLANSASYLVGTEIFFLGVKRPEFEVNNSSSAADVCQIQ
jgi:hypothetical protein